MPEAIPRVMDKFGADDMAMPELKLVQNVGGDFAKQAGAQPGNLWCTLTGEIFKEGIKIVIVDIRKQRTYWGRTEISEEPPECASLDGTKALEGLECSKCQFYTETPWAIKADERRKYCVLHYSILAVVYETGLPLLIRTTGNSAKAVKELVAQLKFNRELKGEIHRALIQVTSLKHKSSAGDSYAYQFRLVGLVKEQEKVEELKVQTLQLIGTLVALPEGREEEQVTPLPDLQI